MNVPKCLWSLKVNRVRNMQGLFRRVDKRRQSTFLRSGVSGQTLRIPVVLLGMLVMTWLTSGRLSRISGSTLGAT